MGDNGTVLMALEIIIPVVKLTHRNNLFLYRRRLAELYRVKQSKLFYVPPDMYSLQLKIDLRQLDHECLRNIVRF